MTTYMQEELELEEKPINTDVRVCYDRYNSLRWYSVLSAQCHI